MTPTDHPGRHHPLLTVAAIVVPVVVVAIVAVQLFVVHSPRRTVPQTAVTTIQVKGTLQIFDTAGAGMVDNGAGVCVGSGGYSAIKPGAAVVITDHSGATLATTVLGNGAGSPGTSFTPCVFTFAANIAGGTGADTIAIANIARSNFPQAQMAAPVLTLGDNAG